VPKPKNNQDTPEEGGKRAVDGEEGGGNLALS
jgi:hypothetical protein